MFNTGLEIRLDSTKDTPVHFDHRYLLFYVLEGKIEVSLKDEKTQLEKGNILLINSLENYSTAVKAKGRICMLYIDSSVFSDLLGNGFHTFRCNSAASNPDQVGRKVYEEMQWLLNEILRRYLQNNSRIGYMIFEPYIKLLDCIIKNFLTDTVDVKGKSKSDLTDERIRAIILYIHENYHDKISLADLAKIFYASESHLSRVLKNALGINFLKYVNEVRMDHALKDLLGTANSILQIAMDNGFSSLVFFNQVFKKNYGHVPSEYRKKMKSSIAKENDKIKIIEEQTREELDRYFEEEQRSTDKAKMGNAPIEAMVDATQPKPYTKNWISTMSAGTASDLRNPKMQEHIVLIKKHLDIRYIRFWGIFHEEMMIFPDESLIGTNFRLLDEAIDFLLSHKFKPFMQLGPKPKTLIQYIKRELYSHESVLILDLDAMQWGTLIDLLMKHLVKKYGIAELETWIFEMWSPCHWDGEWYKLYSEEKYTIMYRTVKKYVPNALVGGCEFIFDEQRKKMGDSVEYWRLRNSVPDFISYTFFPYGTYGKDGSKWITDRDHLLNTLKAIRSDMEKHGIGDLKLFITSWNLTISNRNVLHDSVYKGAYIVKNVIDAIGEADMVGYWICSDAYAEHFDSHSMLFGAAGLLSKNGHFKPSMYAFIFLQKLKDYLIAKGENYIVTRSEQGNYIILFHNLKTLNYTVYLKPESELSYQEFSQYFEDKEPLDINICLGNVKDGLYNVRTQRVNNDSGSILDEWHKIGGFSDIYKEEMDYLGNVSLPSLHLARQTSNNGTLVFPLSIKANEFGVIEIFPAIV